MSTCLDQAQISCSNCLKFAAATQNIAVRLGLIHLHFVHIPDDVVHTDDILRSTRRVVDDRGARLHPHPVTILTEEAVVLADRGPFHYHCKQEENTCVYIRKHV